MGRTTRDMYCHSYLYLSNIAVSVAVLGLAVCLTRPAHADPTLVFDRGLPTENLNNAAGADRSNVAWGDSGTTNSIGDTFTLGGAAGTNYSIDTIRVWVVAPTEPAASAFSLWFGGDAGAFTAVQVVSSATASISAASYGDPLGYQRSSGGYYNVYELDFTGVDIMVNPGTYAFSVSGPGTNDAMTTPSLHASNANLSGSPQMGPNDGIIYGFNQDGSMASGYPWASIAGWDKPSDIDVQVFADVPEPPALALLGLGLAVFGVIRWRGIARYHLAHGRHC